MKVNFGNLSKNYSQFRNDLPIELMDSLKVRGIYFSSKEVADLGSGTGVLSRALLREGAAVVGVEPAPELIEEALAIDRNEGLSIQYVKAYSESTSLDSNLFDYVTVLRAWHWFDREKTLEEVSRILKNKGKLIVIDSGFVSKSKVIDDTIQIVKAYMLNGELKPAGSKANSKQFINNFPVEWYKEWQENQFDLKETYKFKYTVSFTNKEWCGRIGSLSWLSAFSEKEREGILKKIYNHLEKEFGDTIHHIQHGCFVAILNRV